MLNEARALRAAFPDADALRELTVSEIPPPTGDEDDPCLEPGILMKRMIPAAALVAILLFSAATMNWFVTRSRVWESAVLLLAWRQPRFTSDPGTPVPRIQALVDNRAVRAVARLLVLALFGWVGLAAAFGPDRLTNPAQVQGVG